MSDISIINLEDGLPKVHEALDILEVEIQILKSSGNKFAIVVHGYGHSTQGGGKIKIAARKRLIEMKNQTILKEVVFGENFSIYTPFGAKLINLFSNIREYATGRNLGVTIIELN